MVKVIGYACFACLVLLVLTINCPADIFFEEDFESGEISADKWLPTGEWEIRDADGPEALGKHVLFMDGGEAGISVKDDFEDFEYHADFRAGAGGLTGFVFRAQDTANNFYMHQVSVTGSGHTPNNMRWHWKVGGGWNVEPIPFMNGVKLDMAVWYHVKYIVEGFSFKTWVVELEKIDTEEMVQIGDWEDAGENYSIGAIGFRASGGEAMEYDNIIVGDIGTLQPVEPGGKLSVTWGALKERR